MKRLLLSAIIIFMVATSFAQTTYYKGEWTKINSTDNFEALIKLQIKDTAITGEIVWKFISVDSTDEQSVNYYKGQKGKTGIEYVKGSFFAKTNDLQFEGIEKTDPFMIIGLDKYLLKLSLDKKIIYGRTLAQGENNGLICFYKVDNTEGAKEFNLLRTKLFATAGEKAMRY